MNGSFGISWFSIGVAFVTLVYGSLARDKSRDQVAGTVIWLLSLAISAYSLLKAFSGFLVSPSSVESIVALERLAFCALYGACVSIFRWVAVFPRTLKVKWVDWVFAAIWILPVPVILFTGLYLPSVTVDVSGSYHTPGIYMLPLQAYAYSILALSALVLFLKGFFLKVRIFRLQARAGSIFILAATVFSLLVVFILPGYGFPLLRNHSGLSGSLLVVGLYWAIGITRVFDTKSFFLSLAVNMFVYSVLVLPPVFFSGFAFAAGPEAITAFAFACVFWSYAVSLLKNRLARVTNSRSDYFTDLEAALDKIDFESGRTELLKLAESAFLESLGCDSFSILVEDREDTLKTLHSSNRLSKSVERNAPEIDFALNLGMPILFRTDVLTNQNFHAVRENLVSLMDSLGSDALIVLAEGRSAIGLIALGPKKSGADYTDFDYEGFKRLSGKLFTLVFFLKNVSRESLLETVEKELRYSGQIIQSIQENIDRITHPKADAAFLSRSTRKLGGDCIDFVKVSPDKWFFVLGDVAGKGLNASMSMVIIKSVMRSYLSEERDFARAVVKLNSFIKKNLPRGTFFAGMFGLFDFSKDALYYYNCGIPIMFLHSPQLNNVIEIQGEGRVLGFVPDITPFLKLKKVALVPGTTLFVSTDGILESESARGERFGKERLQRCVSEYRRYPAEQTVNLTFKALSDFIRKDLEDDVTLFSLKYAETAAVRGPKGG